MKKLTLTLVTLALTFGPPLFADLELDKSHSKIGFVAKYMMISDVNGQFDDYDLKLNWDEKDPSKSKVEVTIKASSINTQHSKRDNHLKSPDFFDVEKFPTINFKSNKIEKKGEEYLVTGELTMKGVKKEMSFSLKALGMGKDPFGNTKLAFAAKSQLNRKDYNINWNKALDAGGVLVGDEIQLDIVIMVIKK